MTKTKTPIYLEVCDDLKIYPQAMKRRTHETYMRDQRQSDWVAAAITRLLVRVPDAQQQLEAAPPR